jgi:hypothetical protein
MTADNKKMNARYASEFLAKTEEKVNLHFQPVFLLPGDSASTLNEIQKTGKSDKMLLGWGLCPDNESREQSLPHRVSTRAVCAGVLQYRPTKDGGFYWIRHCGRKKYFPPAVSSKNETVGSADKVFGDQVIGIIDEKGGDYYMVNVFSGTHCVLNRLSFEGATKRNKPELKRGDVVYARVTSFAEGGDMEISCIYPGAIKKDWTTGETVAFHHALISPQPARTLFILIGVWGIAAGTGDQSAHRVCEVAPAPRLCCAELAWKVKYIFS